jgi:hypothetical protein
MQIYGDEYLKLIDQILEEELKKAKSRSDNGSEDEGTCETQDE